MKASYCNFLLLLILPEAVSTSAFSSSPYLSLSSTKRNSAAAAACSRSSSSLIMASPTLHLFEPCTSIQLSEKSEGSGLGWTYGEDNDASLVIETMQHQGMENVSAAVRSVAERLQQALDGAWLPASESDTQGIVIVISGVQQQSPLNACCTALGIKEEARSLATEKPLDLHRHLQCGFCYNPDTQQGGDEGEGYDNDDDVEEEVDDEDKAKIVRATAIMADELTDTFEFNFTDEVVTAPVIYGGRVISGSDDIIVGILSMRVWT